MDTFLFYGLSTAGSSVMDAFPDWSDLLGLEASIHGVDIPMGAPPAAYVDALDRLRADDAVVGALITSHKVAFFEHARDRFDELDADSQTCREISCIAKRDGRLLGFAKDPAVANRVLGELIPPEHWREHSRDALCLGAGGAGAALSVALLGDAHEPSRLLVTDTNPEQLDRLRDVHRAMGADGRVEYHHVQRTAETDALIAGLAPGSLVVNATGVGKDVPGSPMSDGVLLPEGGIAWELNYRGDLTFLRQAEQQCAARGLRVADGWAYFLQAWVAVIAEVFQTPIGPELVDAMAQVVGSLRPTSPSAALSPEAS